jgi:hypothetical protein
LGAVEGMWVRVGDERKGSRWPAACFPPREARFLSSPSAIPHIPPFSFPTLPCHPCPRKTTVSCPVRRHFAEWAGRQGDSFDVAVTGKLPMKHHAKFKFLAHLDGQGLSSRCGGHALAHSHTLSAHALCTRTHARALSITYPCTRLCSLHTG